MNLFYEEYPTSIEVNGKKVPIITDFREYVRMFDILKSTDIDLFEKKILLEQYFKETPDDFGAAMDALADFVVMKELREEKEDIEGDEEERDRKTLYSFTIDYPFIFSAFLQDYGINIRTIPYMHWWEFRLLFEGLSEGTEIKQRIMYRSIDTASIKDKDERRRIERIQRAIRLPEEVPTDYDIGDAFGW